MADTTNELDLVVKYAQKKGGGTDGQLIIDDVELSESSDNRNRHGIGNRDPQNIERGNRTYEFSTTTMMSEDAAEALQRIKRGNAVTDTIYVRGPSWTETASGMVVNELTTSASDGGDTTVDISADLLGIDLSLR